MRKVLSNKQRGVVFMLFDTQNVFIVIGAIFVMSFFQCVWPQESSEEAKYFNLEEVVVTATRTPRLLKNVAVSTTVVTREEIEEMHAQNVGEALKNIVGVKVNTYGSMGAKTSVTLRGSTSNQVLVLVDGIPVNVPSLGTADFSMYPVDNVERIEVIRGPGCALYGANALGGIVNIITRDVESAPFTEAYVSYGAFNTQIYCLKNGAKIDRFGYLITASHNSSDGDRENSECNGYHCTGKGNYDLGEEAKLTFSTGYSEYDKGVPGSITWLTPNVEQDDKKNWFYLGYKSILGERSDVTGKVFFNRYRQEYEDPDSLINDVSKNHQLGFDLQQNFFAGEVHALTWGISWERDKVDIKDMNEVSKIGGEQELTTKAAYFQDEISFFEPSTLTLGLRYDHHSVYGSEVSPKASGLYRLTEKTGLRASVGCAFRAPTVNDLYWRDNYAVGNPDLNPEKSIGYDFGIEHQFSRKVLGRFFIFRNDVDDMISWADPDGDWVWESYNLESACIQGIETEVKAQFSKQFSSTLFYTYLDARDEGETYHDKYLRYKPGHKGGCRLTYETEGGAKLSLDLGYTDSVYSDRANTSKLDSFFLLDARVSKVISEDTEIFVAGKNLLDEKYQLHDGYPMPGASIMGGLRVKF